MFNIFKKSKKDILAVILTSSDIPRARRTYESLIGSPKTVSIDIEIIVNSLDKSYLGKIQEEFKEEGLKITETESNGTCSRGKNTVFDHFRNHKQSYRYLLFVDGDDFFYPPAFGYLEKMIAMSPDIIGLQWNDMLINRYDERTSVFFKDGKEKQNSYIHHIEGDSYLHSWNEEERNLCKEFPKSVFKNFFNQFPPDRILLLSERILKNEPDLYFHDELNHFDDYIFSVYLYERALNKGYVYAHFSNSFCYVYDRLNENAVSKNKLTDQEKKEFYDKVFNEEFKPLIKKCDGDIDFTIIPHIKFGPPSDFTTEDKLDFLRKNIII